MLGSINIVPTADETEIYQSPHPILLQSIDYFPNHSLRPMTDTRFYPSLFTSAVKNLGMTDKLSRIRILSINVGRSSAAH